MSQKKLNKKSFYTILYCITGFMLLIPLFGRDMSLITRLSCFLSQYVSFFASILFFKELFKEKDESMAYFGVLLLAISPYRFFIAFEQKDKWISLAFSLLPLLAFFVLKSVKNKEKKILFIILGGAVLGVIGFLHFPAFTVLIFVLLTVIIVFKEPLLLITFALGVAISIPFCLNTIRYLLNGGFEELNYSCQSIMTSGYRFGSFFNTFVNIDSNPGFGIGLIITLITGAWNLLSGKKRDRQKYDYYMFAAGVFFMILASRKFPWEFIQRVADIFLRYVGMFGNTTIFAGLAYCFFTVIGAKAIGNLGDNEKEEKASEIYELVKLTVIFICIGTYILQSSLILK